ncbi:MAG: hypothetical protein RR288_04265 [Oscillibacter sp.]
MMKMKQGFQIAFLVVGALTALEFIFVRGMFTWVIAVGATILLGAVNLLLSARDKEWIPALLFALCTLALCMGYFVLAA